MSASDDGTASQSSYGTGAGSSVADSEEQRQLNEFQDSNDDSDSDLLDQGKKLEDAVFAAICIVMKNRQTTDIRWTSARILLEFLQMFTIVFNQDFDAWNINTNNWLWKALQYVLFRLAAEEQGYAGFISIFYVIVSFVVATVATSVWVLIILKKQNSNNSWLRRLTSVLQNVAYIMFSMLWVPCLDYFTSMFNCHWSHIGTAEVVHHGHFEDRDCLALPHLAHMVVALVVLVVFCFGTLCMSMSDCDLHFGTANAITNAKILGLRILMVLLSTLLFQLGNTQSALMLICAAFILYFILKEVPYYYDLMNVTWVGLYTGFLYTCTLLVILDYTQHAHLDNLMEYRGQLTQAVLYGICPVTLLGAFLCYMHLRYLRKPLGKLMAAYTTGQASSPPAVLRDVYKFKTEAEAEILLRTMRKWDEDGIPDPDTTAFGEFVIKCAMARLPNRPYLLTLYANFIMERDKDGQAGRTHLQLAAKNSPDARERFFIYVSNEVAKKLKSDTSTEGFDLIGYVEFQRSYRTCVRAHKMALHAQRQFWRSLLHDKVQFRDLRLCLELVARTEKQATAVYARVLERYPKNGKLMKAYGRFLEFVKNDPWGASKFYTEAMKVGTEDNLLGLAGNSVDGESSMSKLTTLLGNVDEKNDAVIIINGAGIIVMVNNTSCKLFGYSKAELDGKNISMLMPQPYSSRHNSFLQRYANTGEEHIIGTVRQVVALHKDLTVFPIRLAVQKLLGLGADTMFMGIIRKNMAEDSAVVLVYATPAGAILCADERFEDTFGLDSRDLVGRSLSSLITDVDRFNKFIAQCSELPPEQVVGGALRLTTKLLHKYLAPVEIEATVEFGGSDDQRMLVVSLHCMAKAHALMVTDNKGRIRFATNQLARMVGYSTKIMTDGMNLAGLLPPPYSQLHAGFMKDLSGKPPPGSCRAGAVVHLQHANNTKVPVTLKLTSHDDGEHMQHVIQALPAGEATLLDQQRIELQLNHKGLVLSVNEGASKSIFGFNPTDLIGRPVASFINLFSEWRNKFGEDESLLVMLGVRAEQNHDVTYRCGVHAPWSDEELHRGGTFSSSGQDESKTHLGLLKTLKSRHKEHPAIMTMSMVHHDNDGDDATEIGLNTTDDYNTALLKLSLWRAEGLTSVIEVDEKFTITRADVNTGLMFGVAHTTLLRKCFRGLAGLPAGTQAAALLSGAGKKSMLKEGAAWKTGPVRNCDARHMDDEPLRLQIQAVSKDGKTAQRLLVMVRLLESSTGTLQPLLALRASGMVTDPDAGKKLFAAAKLKQDSDTEEEDKQGGRPDSPELHDKLDSRMRVAEWVNRSFRKGDDDDPIVEPKQQGGKQKRQSNSRPGIRDGTPRDYWGKLNPGEKDVDATGAHGYVEVVIPQTSRTHKASERRDSFDDGLKADMVGKHVSGAGSASSDGESFADGAASVASGSQSGAGSEMEASTAVTDVDDELVVDWRRAKRLKKLNRMMAGNAAQVATDRFSKHTFLVTLFIVVAHVACFASLVLEVNRRYQMCYEFGDMAMGLELTQMISLSSLFIQKCGKPEYSALAACSQQRMDMFHTKLGADYRQLRHIHQGLYLGYTDLDTFDDPRLTNFWTYEKLPEYNWYDETTNGTHITELGNATLWEMGNKYLSNAKEVEFNAKKLKYDLQDTNYFNYIQLNGPSSLFKGYLWSQDLFVDYAWDQLGSLNKILVALLFVEALVVQLTTITYQFLLLRAANVEAMKRFSVFLALPSATIRSMASRQMQVDDDDKSDIDDDEFEVPANRTDADQGQQTTKEGQQTKTVRMSLAGVPDTDDGKRKFSGAGAKGINQKSTSKMQKSIWQRCCKLMDYFLSNMKFKVNGKKLVPHNLVLWKFMVPIFLWVVCVIVIYTISFQKVRGLQGPLASLNAAAHVRLHFARTRLLTTVYGFAEKPEEIAASRLVVKGELAKLKKEYEILLYGGKIPLTAKGVSFNANATAAAFAFVEFSNLFFKTTACLRKDKTKCYPEGSQYYDITHAGLDAMVTRFIDEAYTYLSAPDEDSWPNHTSYNYIMYVAANDMYDGLLDAADLLIEYTIGRFEEVTEMHIILLACTLALALLFVVKMFWPFVQKLRSESKAMAGLMSHLPAEVDIEGHVKLHVLGIKRDDGKAASLRMGSMDAGAASLGVPGMDLANRRPMPIAGLLPPPPVPGKGLSAMSLLGGARRAPPNAVDSGEDGVWKSQRVGYYHNDQMEAYEDEE